MQICPIEFLSFSAHILFSSCHKPLHYAYGYIQNGPDGVRLKPVTQSKMLTSYIPASQDKFGVFQVTTTASRDDKNRLLLLIQGGQDGGLFVHLDEVQKFYFNNAFSYFSSLSARLDTGA